MTEFIKTEIRNGIGHLVLDRPKALNSLSLDMIRSLTAHLLAWRSDTQVKAVIIRSSSDKAFCAGGDIRFFYEAGNSSPRGGSALLEDFFTEEYALNHVIHHYPKPYLAVMDGIIMGGGMGVAQSGPQSRLCIVTERTRMAMPEVNIGLFPDVGGSYFLPRTPGQIGNYLGVTGETIGAADALYAGLADVFVPSSEIGALLAACDASGGLNLREAASAFAARFAGQINPRSGILAAEQARIDLHFGQATVADIMRSLASDSSEFAQKTLATLGKRSPLLMSVTLELLKRGKGLDLAECLKLERSLVRRCFEHGETLEGIRALVIDKDNAPKWNPARLEDVTTEMVAGFFSSPWPAYIHPLHFLRG